MSINATDVTIDEPSGVLDELNSYNNPLKLIRNQLNFIRNWFFTQNGIKTRFGSSLFKTKSNVDADIDGNIIFMDVFSPDTATDYFHFIGTDKGFLYFCRFSKTGDVVQTPVTDLTLSDYPAEIMKLDLQDNSTVLQEINRVKSFQYAILRAPTAVQGGDPAHWQRTPAFDSNVTSIGMKVLNNIAFFKDNTNTLYQFDGTLGDGRKLSTVTINRPEFVSAEDNIVSLFTFNNRWWVVTDTDKMFASAPGDGTTFQEADGVFIKLGRIAGMDIRDTISTKNGVFITLENSTIEESQMQILTGSSRDTYRIDDVDSTAGTIGSSGESINQDFLTLTQYGFANISAFGENDRFGLTQQDTVSAKVNGDVFSEIDSDKVKGLYYSGVGNRKRNWYCCQLSARLMAIYDINFSTDSKHKWSFFDYGFDVLCHFTMLNRWFLVDNNNNILLTDAPNVLSDNGTSYSKVLRSFSYGKNQLGKDEINTLAAFQKQFKDIGIHCIIPGSSQNIDVNAIYDGLPLTSQPDGSPFLQVVLSPQSANDITLSSDTLLSSSVTLGSFEEETIYKKVQSRSGTARTLQIEIVADNDIELEVMDLSATYNLNKEQFDSVNTA